VEEEEEEHWRRGVSGEEAGFTAANSSGRELARFPR
jgi:hypothetical protein